MNNPFMELAIDCYRSWFRKEVSGTLTREEKQKIVEAISELTLQRPIWLDKETDYGEMEQFKKLKPEWYCKDERHIHTRKISGLQLLAVMEEIMLELRYGRTLPCPVFSCHEKEYYKDTEQLIQHLEAKHPRSLKKHGVQKLIEMSQALA